MSVTLEKCEGKMTDAMPGDDLTSWKFIDQGQNCKTLFTIKADGTIVRGELFTTVDEMSLKFWEAVESLKKGRD